LSLGVLISTAPIYIAEVFFIFFWNFNFLPFYMMNLKKLSFILGCIFFLVLKTIYKNKIKIAV
jgi:hypothetical protein